MRILNGNKLWVEWQFHPTNLFQGFIHQSVIRRVNIDLLEVMSNHFQRRELPALGEEPLHNIHVPLGRVARLADHEDVVHTVVPSPAPGNDVVDCQFLGVLNLLSTIPAYVRILDLGDVVLQQIVNLPTPFLVSLECLRPDRETRAIELCLPGRQGIFHHLQVRVGPMKILPESFELPVLLVRVTWGGVINHAESAKNLFTRYSPKTQSASAVACFYHRPTSCRSTPSTFQ